MAISSNFHFLKHNLNIHHNFFHFQEILIIFASTKNRHLDIQDNRGYQWIEVHEYSICKMQKSPTPYGVGLLGRGTRT